MWLLVVTTALAVVIGGTAAASYAYDRATNDRILPGVRIAGIDVSGMTRSQALDAISDRAGSALDRRLVIRAGDQQWTQSLGALGMTVDPQKAVDEAFQQTGTLSWVSRVYHRLTHQSVDTLIPLTFNYDTAAVQRFVDTVATPAVTVQPEDAYIKWANDDVYIHHSKPGTTLKPMVSARLIMSALKVRKPEVDLSVLQVEPAVSDETLGDTLTVDLSTNTLRFYEGFDLVRTYPVATAMYGFTTPVGEWEIVNKVENPTWINPGSAWAASEPPFIGPGPGNPLGTRALYLNASGIRIHGTPSDSSIGTYASHGCIRMHISDSEALYPLVPVGTKVVIYGAPPWGNITFSSTPGV
jgi:lipoprotein-anchoring transpeptidase ErfK/SrfK